MRIRVLILGSKQDCDHVSQKLKDEDINVVGCVSNENLVLDEITNKSADVVIVTDISPVYLRVCEQIYLLRPRTITLVMSDIDDIESYRKVIATGVNYILPWDIETHNLINELKGIFTDESNRLMSLEGTGASTNKSKVILVYGSKGGIGKSTVAVNLAIKLAQQKNKVAILDYNFQFGSVGSMLSLNSRNTISQLVQEQASPSADMIRQFLTLHNSGVSVLLAPNSPEDAATISTQQAERIIAALRVYYDYLIIDMGAGVDDVLAIALDSATEVIFVTGDNIDSLQNAKKGLLIVDALSDYDKLRLTVINDGHSSISQKDIEKVLSRPVWHTLSHDKKVALDAINQGRPVVVNAPKSRLSKEITELALKVDDEEVGKKGKKEKKPAIWGNRKTVR